MSSLSNQSSAGLCKSGLSNKFNIYLAADSLINMLLFKNLLYSNYIHFVNLKKKMPSFAPKCSIIIIIIIMLLLLLLVIVVVVVIIVYN